MKYKLATSTWGNEEINAIKNVIDSDMYSMGNYVSAYEKEFAHYFGSKYAIMTSSGSTANLIMVASLFYMKENNLKKGDEVIVPCVSWSTTYFPLQQYGLKLKFVDIDINTLNYDLKQLEAAISTKTKLIVAVNLLGNPNDFNKINNFIKNKDIIIIEDNCESMGSKFQDKYCGSFGLMGSFSSFFSHHISTMEGGMIITDNEELHHILLCLRAHGWTRNLPDVNLVSNKKNNDFLESFRFVLPGYNVRPLEMSGAIGLEQLKKLPKFIEKRNQNALIFKELFSNLDEFIIQEEIGQSSWFGFSFIINNDTQRESVIKKLTQNKIEVRPIVTGDFTQNEVLKYFDYEIFGQINNAKKLHDNGFFVGNSHLDLKDELLYLKNILYNLK